MYLIVGQHVVIISSSGASDTGCMEIKFLFSRWPEIDCREKLSIAKKTFLIGPKNGTVFSGQNPFKTRCFLQDRWKLIAKNVYFQDPRQVDNKKFKKKVYFQDF